VRTARRARQARRVPFHRRERAGDDEVVEEPKKGKKGKGREAAGPVREGHVLWAGGERVSGWGELCGNPAEANATSQPEPAPQSDPQPEADSQQAPEPVPEPKQKGRKQKQKQKKEENRPKALTPEELEELANNG
jgi:hypothetical protein